MEDIKKNLENKTGLTLDYVGSYADFNQEEEYKGLLLLLKKVGVKRSDKYTQLVVALKITEKDGVKNAKRIEGNSMFTFTTESEVISPEEKIEFLNTVKSKINDSGYNDGDEKLIIKPLDR